MFRERVGTEIGLITGRIKRRYRNGRESISEFQSSVAGGARQAVRKTDYYVHDHAWKLIGAAAGLAFVAGFLLSRRNPEAIATSVDADETGPREVRKKVQKLNSWELLHSSIPLALFLWKAAQASRCARKDII